MRAGVAFEPAPAIWGQAGLKSPASASPHQPSHGFLNLTLTLSYSLGKQPLPFAMYTWSCVSDFASPLLSRCGLCSTQQCVLQTLSAFFLINKDTCIFGE